MCLMYMMLDRFSDGVQSSVLQFVVNDTGHLSSYEMFCITGVHDVRLFEDRQLLYFLLYETTLNTKVQQRKNVEDYQLCLC